ncbi:MAG: YcxB family protein [Flavobacteriales bacterium]|nr:YcxB family protein [Flavobacteriales bacterium]
MKVTTKKYELKKNKYISIATKALVKKEWLYGVPCAVLLILSFIFHSWFWTLFLVGLLVPALYIGFWMIQFAGFTQHEMGKMFFYKMNYEIDGKQFLLKIDAKHGMPVEWKSFKSAYKIKDGYVLTMSKAQFIFLPFSVFKKEGDRRLTETILKRKNLL